MPDFTPPRQGTGLVDPFSAFADWGDPNGAFAKAAAHVHPGGTSRMADVDPNYVRLRAVDFIDIGITMELNGDDPIKPTGYPTRDTLSRPTASTPSGAPPLQMPIAVLLDGWSSQTSVEPELKMLDQLAGLGVGEAPVITVEGRAVPYSLERAPDLRWALTGDPDYGDVRTRSDGDRVYAEVTFTVVQVTALASVPDLKNPKRQFYVVPKSGGYRTLKAISRHLNGKPSVDTLKALNPAIRDSTLKLKAGTKVRTA
jgi:hypothetical protein